MTAPRTETTDRPDDRAEQPKRLQLSAVQLTAGALASVSAAVVASIFGVAGTLIGAAVASVISTISAALYGASLDRTNERLRRVRGQLTARGPAAAPEPADAVATRELPAHLDPRRAPAPARPPRWPRFAVYAVAVFVLGMGIVTGIELIGQQPVSALVGTSQTSGATTLGELTHVSSGQDTTPSTPAPPVTTTAGTPAPEGPGTDGVGTGTATPAPTATTSQPSERTATSTAGPGDTASGDPSEDAVPTSSAPTGAVAPTP